MSVLLAFFKRHALDESLRLSALSFYGYLFAALMLGIALAAFVAVLQ